MKPKGPIWQNFDSITKDGAQRAVCKNCSKDMVPDAKRMKKHHDDCIATSSSAETVPKKVPKQTTLFNVMTSQEKQHEIELQIGRYFVSSNTAFRQVENQEFQKLVQKLKPGVEIPNRKRLAGPILDELYNEEQKKVKALCSGMMGTLAIDGWSTVTNEPVIGVNVTTNSGSYLVDTVDTSGFPHNSEYLASLTKEEISEIFEKTLKESDTLYRYLEDISLKRNIQDLQKVFRPISFALDKLQSSSCLLGDVVEIWYEMRTVFPIAYCSKLSGRSELLPVFYAANMLDHRYRGSKLDACEVELAMDYIKDFDSSLIPEVTNYIAKFPPYNEYLFEGDYKNTSPGAWWTAGTMLGFGEKLTLFSSSLVTATPATANLERNFSTLGLTYGKLRSQLGVDKAGKLAFLTRQFNK